MRDETGKTGWSVRGLVAAGAGLLAAVLAAVFLAMEARGVARTAEVWIFAATTLAGHAAGGALAGAALAGLFGRRGAAGWALAALAGALVTLLGGLAGALAENARDLFAGADPAALALRVAGGTLVAPLAIAAAPWLGAVWAGAIAALHLGALAARARAA